MGIGGSSLGWDASSASDPRCCASFPPPFPEEVAQCKIFCGAFLPAHANAEWDKGQAAPQPRARPGG